MQPRRQFKTSVDAGGRAAPGHTGRLRGRSLAARSLMVVLLAAFTSLVALPMQAQAQVPIELNVKTLVEVSESNQGGLDISLKVEPTSDVIVNVVSNDTGVFTVSPASFTFTPMNWFEDQGPDINPVQDADAIDDTGTLTVSGTDVTPVTVTVKILDDDLLLTLPQSPVALNEEATATFEVVLASQPSVDRTVFMESGDTEAVTIDTEALEFTNMNWDESQTVTITGVADDDATDEQVTIRLHGPGVTTGTVTVDVTDDDTRGMTITPRMLDVDEGGTATYTVTLDTLPVGDVTVATTSSDTGKATVFPETLTFTTGDWDTAQTVTVTGVEDGDANDENVTLSNEPNGADYVGVSTEDVALKVADNDTPSVRVSRTTLTVTEEDTTGASYTLELSTLPTANVTVTVEGHAGTDVTPFPITVTFTSQNWETAQTVTVKAGNDSDKTNDLVTLTHSATSTDADYGDIAVASVTVTVSDNDRSSQPPTSGGGGGGGFGPALIAPKFVDGFRTSRPLDENARVGDAVGDPVTATHPDDLAVTYFLSGTDAALFTVDEETGQIRLGQAATPALGQTYTVNLTATDSSGTGAIIIVDIAVTEAAFHPYDLNKNGSIEKFEVLEAVADYFADVIEKAMVLEVIALYFSG